ncbi:hypothetical protein [Novosphingobium lindaniclasticum]|uniref:PilZ domain-containing protein n=1 Tax=Novosphingobium lindaniclasticum LE124 TaxID=1096930 RepID=T0HZI5_9SPHN|nr:hypothetical protein [Novosphingobium lindaniclasticum]EQB17473.1 hypothetical protein L284_07880 [Novosphingobium lindaniclasticum LE124]
MLRIRAHQRYAVRRETRILRGLRLVGTGLLVEVSQEGCRIGCVMPADMLPEPVENGEMLVIAPEGAEPFEARVRWSGNGTLGFRLTRAFHHHELDRLIRTCRGEFDAPEAREYGT